MSDAVSGNNPYDTREGQTLPEVRRLLFENSQKWDPDMEVDWAYVKKVWTGYWDLRKPVLLEKSPPNLIRASDLITYFEPAYFIVLMRHPLALAESMMRRDKISIDMTIQRLKKLIHYQYLNATQLPNCITIKYEDLVADAQNSLLKIAALIPELTPTEVQGRQFKAHNNTGKPMTLNDRNIQAIQRLSEGQRAEIAEKLEGVIPELNYFGYSFTV